MSKFPDQVYIPEAILQQQQFSEAYVQCLKKKKKKKYEHEIKAPTPLEFMHWVTVNILCSSAETPARLSSEHWSMPVVDTTVNR